MQRPFSPSLVVRWAALLGVLCCAWTSTAYAAPTPVPYSLPDLVDKKVPFADVTLSGTAEADGCKFKVDGQSIVPDQTPPCPSFWGAEVPGNLRLKFGNKEVLLTAKTFEKAGARGKLKVEKDGVAWIDPAAGNANQALYLRSNDVWTRVAYDATTKLFKLAPDDLKKPGARMLVNFDDAGKVLAGGVLEEVAQVAALVPSTPSPSPATTTTTTTTTTTEPCAGTQCGPRPMKEWCKRRDRTAGYTSSAKYMVCIDLLGNYATQMDNVDVPGSHLIRPNETTLVIVQHPKAVEVAVEMQGEQAVFQGTFRGENAANSAKVEVTKSPEQIERAITRVEFGPRAPGKANVVASFEVDGKPKTRTVELIVEETYVGAVRFGIGTVFAGAADVAYAARSVNGSSQKEVVAASGGVADFEIVLGAAPFIFDLIDGAPRRETKSWGIAPYFGFGLLSVTGDAEGDPKLDFLKSVHLGAELEFAQNFSLAATFVIRRVERLPEDLQVGSAIDGDIPTRSTVGIGPGFVLNVSPDFLKVVTQGSGTLVN